MTPITQDAREFGLHVKQGGWRLGLLVARNVELQAGGRPKAGKTVTIVKVSAAEFARQSDTSVPRISRFVAAWEKAAEAGHVPAANTLTPGQEIDLDADTLPEWGDFYDASQSGGGISKAGRERLLQDPEHLKEVLKSLDIGVITDAIRELNDDRFAELVAHNEQAEEAGDFYVPAEHTPTPLTPSTPQPPVRPEREESPLAYFNRAYSAAITGQMTLQAHGIRLYDLEVAGLTIDELDERCNEIKAAITLFQKAFADAKNMQS